MKKRILSIALVFCMLLSVMPTAFAAENTTVKIAGTEYSSSESLPTGVTIDWTNKKITLNGATITVNDATGTVTSGIEINDTGDWTLELTGTNTVNVTSGAVPTSIPNGPAAVYGVSCKGNLTVTGTGTLNTTVQNDGCHMYGQILMCSAVGVYSEGTLTFSGGSVTAIVIKGATAQQIEGKTPAIGMGAIYSQGTLTISGGTVYATDNTGFGPAISSATSVSVSGGTVNANAAPDTNSSDGEILTSAVNSGGNVSISGGEVTIGGGAYYAISGKDISITGDSTKLSASNVVNGLFSEGGTVTVSAAQTIITVSESGSAVNLKNSSSSITAGTYSPALAESMVPGGYVQQNGTIVEASSAAPTTAWIENGSAYTGEHGGVQAIAAAKGGDHVYLNVATTASRSGLEVRDTITVWVKDGVSFQPGNLTFTGEGVEAKVTTGASETLEDGTTYHSYIYTMYVTESAAIMKVVHNGEVVGYFSEFGNDFAPAALQAAQIGDTIVMLKDYTVSDSVYINKAVTLDLNGHTITGGVQATYLYNGSLTITDSSESKQGKIVNSNGSAVTGNLIINGGTFNGSTYSVYGQSNQTAIINGGTFIGNISFISEGTTAEIYGGDFTQSGIAPNSRGIVLVSGTSISGYCGDGENDADVVWKVEPTTGTVTVNGKTLTNLKLTLSGEGTMKDYANSDYNNAPWYGMREQITEVVIDCADLGNYAMKQMGKVTSLTLNEGLTSIGNYAFQNTPINNALTIPASVTSIGNNAFENCGVTAFSVAGGSSFTAENGVLLNSGKTTIVAYPDGAAQFVAYTAPSTVTSIAPGAFSGSEVKSIIISGTLTSAFYLPTFENTDKYNFEGWYSTADFSGDRITNTTGSAYAKWVSTVTFDANGGTLANNVYSVAHDTAIGTLPTPTWTDDTKEFASWNTQADGLGTTVTAETVPTGNVTYYAIYKIKNSDVVINPIPNQTYTGSAITPNITYKIGEGDVQTITDAVWTNNTNVGTASTTVTVNNQQYPVTFQITKATYDMSGITFENDTVTYDGQAHSLDVNGTLPNGVTVSFEGNGQTNAGTYTVTAKFAGDADNYEAIEDMTATLKIEKARLTITAHDKTMYVGDDVPTLTYTVTGLVEGEALTREPDVSCTALGDTVGNFAIGVSGAAASSNYWSVITYVDGTLFVENRPTVPSGPAILPSVPSNNVTVENIENGTIKVTPSYATKGQTVTLTITPDSGYELDELAVLDKNGIAVELTKKSDNQYTFKMPSGKVTVEATFVEAVAENPFVDVSKNAYYYDAVLWAVENGITTGTGADTFSPNAVCTRAQVVTFLWRAAGCPEPVGAANAFDDVASNAYYAKAVQWAVEQGITLGTGDGKFSPDAECTRGQIVTFLWRSQGSENATANNPFVDVADGTYYEDAVLWAVEEAITNGTSADTFSPDADCTRGQIVTFLYRCLAE